MSLIEEMVYYNKTAVVRKQRGWNWIELIASLISHGSCTSMQNDLPDCFACYQKHWESLRTSFISLISKCSPALSKTLKNRKKKQKYLEKIGENRKQAKNHEEKE